MRMATPLAWSGSAEGALFGIVTADDLINLLAMELSMMTDTIVDQPLREARLRT